MILWLILNARIHSGDLMVTLDRWNVYSLSRWVHTLDHIWAWFSTYTKFILQNLITKRSYLKKIQTHNLFFTKRRLRYTTLPSSFFCSYFLFFNFLSWFMQVTIFFGKLYIPYPRELLHWLFLLFLLLLLLPLATIGVAYIGWSTALPPCWGGWQTASC